MKRQARFFLAVACVMLSPGASAIQQTQSIKAGKGVSMAVADPVSHRIFTANMGTGRYGDGASIGVIERDGTASAIATSSVPAHIAIGTKVRRVLVSISGFGDTGAVVIDADTLQSTRVATGNSPLMGIIVEATNRAYVIGRNATSSGPTGSMFVSPVISGTLTEIDLATNESHVYTLPSMQVENLVADPAGKRVYVTGSNYFRTGESMPGFVHVFDATTKTVAPGPVRVGRLLDAAFVSGDGGELFVVGHEDFVRSELPAGNMRRNGIRPVVYVLDGATLAVERILELPDTKNLDLLGEKFVGAADFDRATGRMYLVDWAQQRLSVVDVKSGAQRHTDVEFLARGIAFNPTTGNVVVSFPTAGVAGIFNADGERIDTVPVGTAIASRDMAGSYRVSTNPANGDTYVAVGHDASLVVLPAASSEPGLVNFTGLWWNPGENGWGVYLEQQGATLFAALFTHDASGAPTWMVMPDGKRQADGAFTGVLYRTTGPREQALANLREVGTMRFAPASASFGALSYRDGDGFSAETIERGRFSAADAKCAWTPGTPAGSNFTSLWYNPSEPGWGLAVTQQGNTAFGVLFGFDAQNRPTWAAMSNGEKAGGSAFTGALYRSRVDGAVETVGNMTIGFDSPAAGRVSYDLQGASKASMLERQRFGALASDCSN